jgi:hypothetical protein
MTTTIQKLNESYDNSFIDKVEENNSIMEIDSFKIESINKIIETIVNKYKLSLYTKFKNNSSNDSLEIGVVNELLSYDWKYIQDLNLYQIFGKKQQMTEQIWKTLCGCVNGMVSINSDMNLLIKENFNIKYETKEISMLFDYVASNDGLCIAGGYPTIYEQKYQRICKQ